MNFRKNILLLTGGGVCLALLAGALVMLFKYRDEYTRVATDLESSQQRLEQLHRQDPFPSKENVAQVRKNHEVLEQFFDSLVEDLQAAQVEPEDMEPVQFRQLLESTTAQVRQEAGDAIKLAGDYSLGFDVYQKGALPKPKHIQRLVVQTKTISALCRLLFKAGISELTSISRDQFDLEERQVAEQPQTIDRRAALLQRRGAAARRRGAPAPSPREAPGRHAEEDDGLFEKETIELGFIAREEAVWNVLNELAKTKLFAVVTEVQMMNEKRVAVERMATNREEPARRIGPAPVTPALGFTMDAQAEAEPVEAVPLSHDERIIAGHERVRVNLKVDVYRLGLNQAEPTEAVE